MQRRRRACGPSAVLPSITAVQAGMRSAPELVTEMQVFHSARVVGRGELRGSERKQRAGKQSGRGAFIVSPN